MESDPHIVVLVLFLGLTFLSAVVAGGESAFLSLSEQQKSEIERGHTKSARRLKKLFSELRIVALSLKLALVGVNTAIIFSAFYLITQYLQQTQYKYALTFVLVLVVVGMLLFLINEMWAKMFVLKHNEAFVRVLSLPVFLFVQGTKPLTKIVVEILNLLASKVDVADKASILEHQKIMVMVDNGEPMGELKAEERAMINSIVTFGETEVHEIMVPRTDMVCIEENTSLQELTSLMKEKGHTRIPLYREGVDNILGIFHAKDLLPYVVQSDTETIDLKALARPAYFVPETKKVHLLLKEFQKEKYHMAIVVDEYGGTAGLVTLEDVLEEIVGEIQDEYDKELPLYRKLDENTYLVDAKIDLHLLNEKLDSNLPTEGEYESLGGFILSLTGYVPEEKEVVKYDGYAFIVEKIERNRIVEIKVRKEARDSEDNSSEQDR